MLNVLSRSKTPLFLGPEVSKRSFTMPIIGLKQSFLPHRIYGFGPFAAELAAEHTGRHVLGAVRAENAERGRGAAREAVARNLLDRAHAHHADQAENVPPLCDAIYPAAKCRRHHDPLAVAFAGRRVELLE